MSNRAIWDALKTPPAEALKKISGGRLNGMTDISPQWRYEVMTQHFGTCGVGWVPEIIDMWTEPGSDGQVMAFVKAELRILVDGRLSSPISGVGGSMLIAKEKAGLHSSDEAFKMAYTDALSVCMKMLGVAADVYGGKMNGKYSQGNGNDNTNTGAW